MSGHVGAAPMLEQLLEDELAEAGLANALEDERRLRELCVPAADGTPGGLDDAAAWLKGLPVARIRSVIQILTMRFHLRNKAEQLEIARINRERERIATAEQPRAESVAEAIATLAARGATREQVLDTLGRLDIQPTLTAHPTEARRRAVLRKQARIAAQVVKLDANPTPAEREAAETELRRVLLELVLTDEVRAERLDAIDEVRNGLHFLSGSIWQTIPQVYADLRRELDQHFPGGGCTLPPVLKYRSWIGGDRDGNPRVTPQVTRQTLDEHRAAVINKYLDAVEQLRLELTISTRRRDVSDALIKAIDNDEQIGARHLTFEPYRVRLLQIARSLRACKQDRAAYSAQQFKADLAVIRDSLQSSGLDRLANQGTLADLLYRLDAFGFHLAALDIRQHSDVQERALAEIFRSASVCDDYAELSESDRLALLRAELASPRPLVSRKQSLPEPAAMVLETFRTVADAIESDPASIGSYIISMTHEVSDVLETLVLAKEVGLYRPSSGGAPVTSLIDVAPLFETIDDLRRAEPLLEELFSEPVYMSHLQARGDFQEIMLGYSDSNKDGGYWVANWLLHKAQREICLAGDRAGVRIRLFHGRGGTIGRGGGRANRAILAAPPESRTGAIRFTEQGEVISFRYALAAIAHRHVEQIVSAMIMATYEATAGGDDTPSGAEPVMERIAERSMEAYRALIDDPEFWPWYSAATPIVHISELPMASRPVMRSPGTADFDKLRAIPWGFAWTQMRATVPGWFGIGSGLASVIDDDPRMLDTFRDWNERWPFFAAIIANAEQELARARLEITERYAAASGANPDHAVLAAIRGEHDRAAGLILSITGSERLLDRRPVIQRLIDARNPDTDALNLCQIELMARARSNNSDAADLKPAILASLNGIAAAMQSTG